MTAQQMRDKIMMAVVEYDRDWRSMAGKSWFGLPTRCLLGKPNNFEMQVGDEVFVVTIKKARLAKKDE